MWRALGLIAAVISCSAENDSPTQPSGGEVAGSNGGGSPGDGEMEALPLQGGGGQATPGSMDPAAPGTTGEAPSEPGSFTLFRDSASGFETDQVHDADREIVHFDPSLGAMVWSATGESVSGWTTNSADLSWTRSGVAFRVRFGTEQGERRAYFTETNTGTICNLSITAPERLSISGTSEMPPGN